MAQTTAKTAKYEFVRQDLLRRIGSGEFAETGRLPSENEVSRDYGVSVMTARKAFSDLVHEGHVVRVQGKGSFVASGSQGKNEAPPAIKGLVPLLLISHEESDSSQLSIIYGAHTVLSENGYSMTIESSEQDSRTEAQILARCLRDRVAGVLAFAADPSANRSHFTALRQAGIPFVLLDRRFADSPCTVVASYNFDGMYRLTDYLLKLGHRRLAYVANERFTNVHEERLAGFRAALAERGVTFHEEWCLRENYPQLSRLPALIREQGVTAVVCMNDHMALDAADYLKENGLRIPQDVSLTGFDDSTISRYGDLTTMRQDFARMGALAAEKLVEQMQGKDENEQIFLPVSLVVRHSTAAPNAEKRSI